MVSRPKYVLVTGCGRGGIGEALVKEYASRGLHPIATVLPSEAHDHLSDAGITWYPLDVTSNKSIDDLKHRVSELTDGHLDILVNNAGICYTMTAIDTDVTKVEAMFNVNVFGPMRMVHEFHGMLIQSAGTIVNIGSVGGIVPYVYGASYNATKAALQHYSNTLRVEMAPLGVKVVTIISGNIGTNILNADYNRKLPEGSFYSPLSSEFETHVRRRPETTDRFEYARNVAAASLKTSPPAWFWYGSTTWSVWLLDTFAWRSVFDGFMWNMFNFGKLRNAYKR